jgi:hypothetical protein
MTQPTEQDRHEFDPTPAGDYGTLFVQFKGLLRLYNSEAATRSEMSKTITDLRKRLVDGANDSVNSQRAANARLTDEVERLQARVAELEAICENVPEGQPPAQPEQRFQQIGFTRIDRIGRPSAMIIADTKYRAASDAGVYVPVFVGEGDTQAPAVGDAVQQSCAECGPVDDGTALYCVRCVERMGLPAPMPETIKQH